MTRINGLDLTPYRLQILAAAVTTGGVYREAGDWYTTTGRCVTSAAGRLLDAGLLAVVDGPWAGRRHAEVTQAGRAVLDEAGAR